MSTNQEPSVAKSMALHCIREARDHLKSAEATKALAALRPLVESQADIDASQQSQLGRLARRIGELSPQLPVVRIAFGAESTVDDLVALLRWNLLMEGVVLEPHIIPFGTWEQQVHDPESPAYRFQPQVVWIFAGSNALGLRAPSLRTAEQAKAEVDGLCARMSALASTLVERTSALVVVNNVPMPAWRTLGNLEASMPGALAATVQLYNEQLARALPKGAVCFDLAYLASSYGLARWEDPRLWFHSKHPFALGAHGMVSAAMARFILAARGRSRKCVVVDLDNTLWGGVVGDDGIEGIVVGKDGGARGEAFSQFQSWLKALSERGVALAVCSKNEEATAQGAFTQRSGMILALQDFAAFRANWKNKADNIREIAKELNLGLDSFVFVDDNPAERELVRRELPEVAVPELPTDPADYAAALSAGRWFETLALSDEDRNRTRAYQANAARQESAALVADLPSYLRSLQMQARWGRVTSGSLARVVQLINKTNQFHPTTTRYSEAQVAKLMLDERHWIGQFALADRFGDHGIIAAAILAFEGDEARIDTWVMSCRVFSRTMEHFTFAVLSEQARRRNCTRLLARYVPSVKNGVVAGLFESLGAVRTESDNSGTTTWCFDLGAAPVGGFESIVDASTEQPAPAGS